MDRSEVKIKLLESRVFAVIRANEVELAREMANAFINGGITAIELTTSIPNWGEALNLSFHRTHRWILSRL
jgi:2-keto-3-deoxy-6-phosphogluconate aldolase